MFRKVIYLMRKETVCVITKKKRDAFHLKMMGDERKKNELRNVFALFVTLRHSSPREIEKVSNIVKET
jgi:hypothetical protein